VAIDDAALDDLDVRRLALELGRVAALQARRVGRVAEVVEHAHVVSAREEAPDEVVSDEAYAACDEPPLHGTSALRGSIRGAARGDADALVAEAGLGDLRRAPDVAGVDEHRREAVARRDEAPPDLAEVRRAVAAPLREEDER